jgi:hypothetical protein
MKRSLLAGGVVIAAIALAVSFTQERKTGHSPIVLGQSYIYSDTPPTQKKDTSRLPWPDTTKKPTPPEN